MVNLSSQNNLAILPTIPIAPVEINIDEQKLYYYKNYPLVNDPIIYPVSTSKNGVGELNNSFQTPRGLFNIRAKIGKGKPLLGVFRRRRFTQEICTDEIYKCAPADKDWILGRILWLSGLEPHYNRIGIVDTMRRFIYIHGAPRLANLDIPGSIGCVRMEVNNLEKLFQQVSIYSQVFIRENSWHKFDIISGRWNSLAKYCGQIRKQVFVDEQKIPAEIEFDGLDNNINVINLLAINRQGINVGTARLIINREYIKLGRMAVLDIFRAQGIGRGLIKKAIQIAKYQNLPIIIHAQLEAINFYLKNGFIQEGKEFIEADIPHIKMLLEATSAQSKH